ncbi:MAG: YfhO family protein [Caldilineaceae bacterium]|nr:YfhO family protein [Caldilineaceae bacterium]
MVGHHPGGFMFVLSLVIALSSVVERVETLGTLLFVGMGFVFFALYLLAGRRRQWWALIPGSVLTLFGFFIFALDREDGSVIWRWWPIALILLGVGLAWRAYRRPKLERLSVNTSPSARGSQPEAAAFGSGEGGTPATLGEYSRPVPGASVEILPDPDET